MPTSPFTNVCRHMGVLCTLYCGGGDGGEGGGGGGMYVCVCVFVRVCIIHVYKSDVLPICLQHECTLSICCSAGDNVLNLLLTEPRTICKFCIWGAFYMYSSDNINQED